MPLPRLHIARNEPRQTNASKWIKLERALDNLAGDWHEGEILNLDDFQTIKFKETATDVFVMAAVITETNCSYCTGQEAVLKKNGLTAPLMILDQPIRNKRTTIYYRAQRFFCIGCQKTIQQSCADCHEDHRLTNRLVSYIEKASLNIYKNFSDIARETRVNEHVVRNIFTDHSVKLGKERKITTPAWIAIDEVYPKSRNKAHCAITDPEQRKVLDLLIDKKPITVFN